MGEFQMYVMDAAKIVLGADQAFLTGQWYLLCLIGYGWRCNLNLLSSSWTTYCSRPCIIHLGRIWLPV